MGTGVLAVRSVGWEGWVEDYRLFSSVLEGRVFGFRICCSRPVVASWSGCLGGGVVWTVLRKLEDIGHDGSAGDGCLP